MFLASTAYPTRFIFWRALVRRRKAHCMYVTAISNAPIGIPAQAVLQELAPSSSCTFSSVWHLLAWMAASSRSRRQLDRAAAWAQRCSHAEVRDAFDRHCPCVLRALSMSAQARRNRHRPVQQWVNNTTHTKAKRGAVGQRRTGSLHLPGTGHAPRGSAASRRQELFASGAASSPPLPSSVRRRLCAPSLRFPSACPTPSLPGPSLWAAARTRNPCASANCDGAGASCASRAVQ